MSKKQLFNQIENLFAGLEQDADLYPVNAGQPLSGWTWECDQAGNYLACSIEVEAALGIPAGQFLGKPLGSFALEPGSAQAVTAMLQNGELPVHVNVQFERQAGGWIEAALHISGKYSGETGEILTGYRGFVQVFQPVTETPVAPSLQAEQSREPALDMPLPTEEGKEVPKLRKPPASLPKKPQRKKSASRELPVFQAFDIGPDLAPGAVLPPQPLRIEGDSILTAPIRLDKGQVGLLEIEAEPGRIWTEDERKLVEQITDQLNLALENAYLFAQSQDHLAETETLYRASAELNTSRSYAEILDTLYRHTLLGQGSHQIALCLFDREWTQDEQPHWIESIARWTSQGGNSFDDRYLASAFPLIIELLKPTVPLIIEDIQHDPLLDENVRMLFNQRFGARSAIFISLVLSGHWIGFINAFYPHATIFLENEVRRTTALVHQAAVAVQNLRLIEETRKRAAQLETAAEIARDTSSTLALDNLLKRTVNLICERYGYYHASIFLIDESGLNAVIRESTGEAGKEMMRRGHKLGVGSHSIIGYVTELGKPLVINDVTHDSIHSPNPLLPNTLAELGIPLKIGDRVIGALDVQSNEINAFTQDDINVLQTLADQIAVAVDNARSYEIAQQAIAETRQRVQELSILFNVSQALAGAKMNPEEIANIIARRFIELLDFPEVTISLVDEENDILPVLVDLMRSRKGHKDPQLILQKGSGKTYRLSDYPATRRVIDTMLPLVIQANDPNADLAELEYMQSEDVQTLVIVPLAVKGRTIGIIEMEAWDQARNISPEQLNLTMILANAAAVALENAKLYEEQLVIADKLREVDKLKSQFLANMSHELRTPLNSIIGFSRVIIKGIDGPISELQQQDLSAIYSAGQHLLNLINNILDISKIEAGKMELAFDNNVNLVDLINSCVSTAVGLVKDKPVKLEKKLATDLPLVNADPTRIRQVILNLVSNATKFTDTGTITVVAGVQMNPENHPEVIVKVNDTGTGISPEDQKKLFQPFSQVDDSPTRKTGGSGLGLSISRLLVEMHGGRIGVNSEVGHGSTFWFTLPLPYTEQQHALPEGGRMILAVDDERPLLNLYDRYLSDHGYQVIPLSDPYQVLQRAKEIRPFAITLDVMMPGKDGWSVLEELKNDPETKDIPVIMCTILENRERGFSLGATDYLMKPILEEDLVKSLTRLNGDGSIQEILVIDDDENDLRLVEKILEKDPQFHVNLAKGGAEGLVSLRSKRPQAVILDLFMPGLDGFMVLEAMRADPLLRDVPVVIFTAGDLSEDQQKYLSQFSENMLHKGLFHEGDLLASIEKSLKRFSSSH